MSIPRTIAPLLCRGMWQTHLAPQDAHLSGFAVVGPDDAWVVGDGGLILHYISGHWLDYFA